MAEASDSNGVEVSLEFSRRLYSNIVEWYKAAETKAQILLSLDAVVVSLLMTALFRDPATAASTLREFGYETWAAVGGLAVAMALSIVCALMCLVSRVISRREMRRRYSDVFVDPRRQGYPPEVMWFFQTISHLDEERFCRQAAQVTQDFEIRALACQAVLLSSKVLTKHVWVNRGFAFAALGLVSLVFAGASYALRVS